MPFQRREQTAPQQTKKHLGHQEISPVVSYLWWIVRQRQQPAVSGPANHGDQNVNITNHWLQLQQSLPFAPRKHAQDSCNRQRGTPDLSMRDLLLEPDGTNGQHEHGHTGAHQSHIDGRGRVQGQVLKTVVTTNAQQAQDRITPPVRPQRTMG